MDATKNVIVECSKGPVSIIIVGVGEEDFENMVELDVGAIINRNKKIIGL